MKLFALNLPLIIFLYTALLEFSKVSCQLNPVTTQITPFADWQTYYTGFFPAFIVK